MFFFIDTSTPAIYTDCRTLSPHDALPRSAGTALNQPVIPHHDDGPLLVEHPDFGVGGSEPKSLTCSQAQVLVEVVLVESRNRGREEGSRRRPSRRTTPTVTVA